MQNRIWETTGILMQMRCLLFDTEGLWNKYGCNAVALEAGFRIYRAGDDIALRHYHECILMDRDNPRAILIVEDPDMYIPLDIVHTYTLIHLSYALLFPRLCSDVLRKLPCLDFEWLAATYSALPFEELDYTKTEQWCREGMYESDNCRGYVDDLLARAVSSTQTASTHRNWAEIAKLYGKVAMARHAGVGLSKWESIREVIEDAFAAWVEKKYGMLSGTVDRNRPVLLNKVIDYARRSADKVAIIVMDGMSFENLYTIQREMCDQKFSLAIDATFSFFPTVTSVARQAIFSGMLPFEHDKPYSLDNEEKQWFHYWRNIGLQEQEIFFHKGIVDEIPSTVKAVGIVINIIDDLMHAELQGFVGIQNGIREWMRNGMLCKMLTMLVDRGYTVYLTSDHGNTSAIGKGRFSKPSILAESASRRAVIYNASFDARELEKFNVMRYSGTYLPNGNTVYLFGRDDCYGDTGKEYITHGGMTLEEAVVPFVRIGERNG